jgi:MFS family permease
VQHSTGFDQYPAAKPVRRRLAIFQGVIAALTFSLLLAGTNATTPLLPVYRQLLGFTPITMSLTFVCYVGVQVIFLAFLSRPSVVRWSPVLLCTAVLAAILSDLSLAKGSEESILFGRALAGVAVGLGTGPAAALVVAAFGASGRSLSATGNLVGAVVGTVFSQLSVALLEQRVAISWTFEAHASVCMVILITLLVTFAMMRAANRKAFGEVTLKAGKVQSALAANVFPIFIGSLAWIAISLAITFFPSFLEERGMQGVKAAGMIVLLICCATSQLCSKRIAIVAPFLSGVDAMMLGLLLIGGGALTGSEVVGIAGFGVLGVGIGIAYRLALVILTKGASPRDHGALSSTYAAITYAVAAITVILVGAAGNMFGLVSVVMAVLAILVLICGVLLVKAPRLSDEKAIASNG